MTDGISAPDSAERSYATLMNSSDADFSAENPTHEVAMLCQGTEDYGIGTIVKLHAAAFPRMSFVALSDGVLVEWLREHGNRVDVVEGLAKFQEGWPSLWTLTRLPGVLAQARRDAARIDALVRPRGIRIIHAQSRPQQIMAGFLRRYGYRSVWQINNSMNRKRLWGGEVLLNHRLAKWGADLLLPASDFIARNLVGCSVASRTIRNAALPMFDRPNELADQPVRCLVAGRLVPAKGHHLAVEAVIRARATGLDVRLDIFGGPLEQNKYAASLRGRISTAGCEDMIQLKGFHPDMRSLHRRYHLGLQCRIDPEPCSLWVCETLVDGLPVIASATGGTPELVEDGQTGLLFPAADVDELARKLIQLASDPARLRAMRIKAFERGQRMFTVGRFARDTLAAYASLAQARHPDRIGSA